MSICSNCYNGCASITSDKCVKYTGLSNEVLGIKNGDSVNYVASAIIGFLSSVLDGSGIKFELNGMGTEDTGLCDLILNEFKDCADITVVDITNALAAAICALDNRTSTLENEAIATEAPYTPSCISGITGEEGTHDVLQAVIDYLCQVSTDLNALEADVTANYVLIADINTYIQTYIDATTTPTAQKNKMVPYTVVEYYGDLSFFDASGAGTGDWTEIYLCNGGNGTPDKRGRIGVGSTDQQGGSTLPSETDPGILGNPLYNGIKTPYGENTVILEPIQLPSHTHTGTVYGEGKHSHAPEMRNGTMLGDTIQDRVDSATGLPGVSEIIETTEASDSTEVGGAHGHTVIIDPSGGGEPHNNVPPVLSCYYIMHIPT